MAKIDVSKIVSDMQKLYAKDKKVNNLIGTGAMVIKETMSGVLLKDHVLGKLLGLPVLPYDRIVQVAGRPDTGKSTLAYELIIKAQSDNVQVILWDSEDKFSPERLKAMGGKPGDVLMIKTNEILKGGELVRRYINAVKEQSKEAKVLVIWDSVGGSQSRSHAERELDDEKHAQPGQDAKENGSIMKMLVALINKFPDSIAVYLANQTYAKIGFMQKGDAASGGAKIEYHSSFIVQLKRIKVLTKQVNGIKSKYGIITRAIVTKNHLTQSETSVHQLDFTITAKGATMSTEVIDEDEDSDS